MISHPQLKDRISLEISKMAKNVSPEFKDSFSEKAYLKDLGKGSRLRVEICSKLTKLCDEIEKWLQNENGSFLKTLNTFEDAGIKPKVYEVRRDISEKIYFIRIRLSLLVTEASAAPDPFQTLSLRIIGELYLKQLEDSLEDLEMLLGRIHNFFGYETKLYANKKGKFQYGDKLLPLLVKIDKFTNDQCPMRINKIVDMMVELNEVEESLHSGFSMLTSIQDVAHI